MDRGKRRRARTVAASLAGLGVVGAGAFVGVRLTPSAPAASARVLDTAVVSPTTAPAGGPSLPPASVDGRPASTTVAPSSSTSDALSPRFTFTTATPVTANHALKKGDCVDDQRGSERQVPCAEPHTREVVAVLDATALEREVGTTAYPTRGSPQYTALDTYCDRQIADYLPRRLASWGRFRAVRWLTVPQQWANDPWVTCELQEIEVTVNGGEVPVVRTGQLRKDLPADQSVEVPAGVCIDAADRSWSIVACPGGNASALGSVEWPASNSADDLVAACLKMLPAGKGIDESRLRYVPLAPEDVAAGAHRAVCFVMGTR